MAGGCGRGGASPGKGPGPSSRGALAALLGLTAELGPGLRLSLAGADVGERTGGSGGRHPLPQTLALTGTGAAWPL